MKDATAQVGPTLEQLIARLHDLEQRVSLLEQHNESPHHASSPLPRLEQVAVSAPPISISAEQQERPPETWQGFPSPAGSGVVSVLGKAVLGIAGAYLLRAMAESASVPKGPLLIIAIAYAGLWMVSAARNHANQFASIVYAVTSALILSPLLWETTARFHFLSPAAAGAVLLLFIVLTSLLSWERDLQAINWIAALAVSVTALGLIIATHALVPLTVSLLLVTAVTEIAAAFGRQLTLRAVPCFASSIALGLLIFIMMSARTAPEGYTQVSLSVIAVLCLAFFVIYAASIVYRSFWRMQRLTVFDVIQGIIAFGVLALFVLLVPTGALSVSLGVLFLIMAVGCYWGSLSRFTDEQHTRNRRIVASWAAGLLIFGSFFLFGANVQTIFLSAVAVLAAWIYRRSGKISVGIHASLFLATAAIVLPPVRNYIVNALAGGSVPGIPELPIWILAASSALCYGIGSQRSEESSRRRALWVLPVLIFSFVAAALVVVAAVALGGTHLALSAARLSVVRTIANCALALILAYSGFIWDRLEFRWAAYTALAFGTLKMLLEDLRFGSPASLVVSLLFYGLVLVILPRITRRSKALAASAAGN